MGLATDDKVSGPEEAFLLLEGPINGSVVVLHKPPSVGVDDVLDPHKFRGLACDASSNRCHAR